MYHPTKRVLFTEVGINGCRSEYITLNSNGKYVRGNRGRIVGRESSKAPEILYLAEVLGERFLGSVTDTLLVERILRYWDEYYSVRYTNCSAFAHYLTTGKFVECDEKNRLLVIEQGMRPYELANRVDIGDMLCLLYTSNVIKSRRNEYANRYRKVQKHRADKGGFAGTKVMKLKPRSYTPADIRTIQQLSWCNDYHFMVCVAKWRGQPVWLSQNGFVPPQGEKVSFAITVGEQDPYLLEVPVFTFIKKRR